MEVIYYAISCFTSQTFLKTIMNSYWIKVFFFCNKFYIFHKYLNYRLQVNPLCIMGGIMGSLSIRETQWTLIPHLSTFECSDSREQLAKWRFGRILAGKSRQENDRSMFVERLLSTTDRKVRIVVCLAFSIVKSQRLDWNYSRSAWNPDQKKQPRDLSTSAWVHLPGWQI